jgi:tetratricopeptide (TPR) repeat protein
MGIVYANRGEYDRALECFEQSSRISEDLGDRPGVGHAIVNMGVVYAERGEYDRALECYEQHLRICEELGDRSGASISIGNMGNAHFAHGEYARALECYEQHLRISEELGHRTGVSKAIGSMGIVYANRGEHERALECYERSVRIDEELGDRRGASITIGNMGNAHYAHGEYDRALECYERALIEHGEIAFRHGVSYWLEGRARLLLELRCQEIMPAYLSMYVPSATSENWLAAVLEQAREDAEECLAISRELSKPDTLFQSQVLLARMEAEEGRLEVALQLLSQMLEDAGEDEQRADLHYWLCKLGARDGDHHAEALGLYCALFEKTPKHTYRQRIEELSSPTEPTASDATDATAE